MFLWNEISWIIDLYYNSMDVFKQFYKWMCIFNIALCQKSLVTFISFCLYLRNQANLCILKSQNIRNTNFPEKWNTYFLEVKNKKNIRKMEGGKFCWIFLLFCSPLNYTLFWRSSHLWLSCTANDLRWNIIGKLEYIIMFINV